MVIYAKVIATIVLIAGVFGFGIPTLVSAPSTLMVVLGFGSIALVPVVIYYIWEDELGKITSKVTKTDNETV
jgi:protein-S-isoprenylcysteine O-methyltransferase Ste14